MEAAARKWWWINIYYNYFSNIAIYICHDSTSQLDLFQKHFVLDDEQFLQIVLWPGTPVIYHSQFWEEINALCTVAKSRRCKAKQIQCRIKHKMYQNHLLRTYVPNVVSYFNSFHILLFNIFVYYMYFTLECKLYIKNGSNLHLF